METIILMKLPRILLIVIFIILGDKELFSNE